MLFNSYIYLLVFLPLTVLVWQLLRRAPLRTAVSMLVVASFVYYGYWDWSNLWIIGASCGFNFLTCGYIARHRATRRGKTLLIFAVTANLGLLAFYKYSGFFSKAAISLGFSHFFLPEYILPLGISFFTFQQVAYLVDAWRGETREYRLPEYLLFVAFFPQLIAGPIVHHREMLPQFTRRKNRGVRSLDLAVGTTILFLGLFKKVVLADYLARTVNPLFDLAHNGERSLTFGEGWAAALAYSLQIYFDFSGYSDMAIGSARMFGIRLPVNFHSPYKAVSIIDFWRRWHITLSRFLRDYLYIPLGGNRQGKGRRYLNLMLTMLIGGFWHGAGWTFILWGGFHGLCLCLNHAWKRLRERISLPALPRFLAIGLTFLAVVVAWVPFRAGNYELIRDGSMHDALATSGSVLASMAGFHGFHWWPPEAAVVATSARAWRPITAGLCLVFFFPNTQEFMRRWYPALGLKKHSARKTTPRLWWQWTPTLPWLIFSLALFYIISRSFDQVSEFIYFQF